MKASGEKVEQGSDGAYDLLIDLPGNTGSAVSEYRRTEIVVDFAPR